MILPESNEDFSSPSEHYIDSAEELADYLSGIVRENGGKPPAWCTVDTEADSMHSYETKLCLIQFGVSGSLAIIDPLSIDPEGMKPLQEFLDGCDVVWMHGADYDMTLFRRTYDWIPRTIWDTQTAARLLGVQAFGLANLLEQEFGVKLSKQSQKADWSRRPLTDKMRAYAYNDVRYLLELGRRFLERLDECGRFEWFIESCEAGRTVASEREEKTNDDQWRVNGWGKLNRKGLLFLKAMWEWRDDECRKLDRPAFKLMSNQDLINLSLALQDGGRPDPPHYLRPAFARRLLKVITETRKLPESEYPKKFRPTGGVRLQIDEARMDDLRKKRNKSASETGIDPTLIAPRIVLEKLSATNLDPDEREGLLLSWQKVLLGISK